MPSHFTWPISPLSLPSTPVEAPLGFNAAAYARQLKDLLPPGVLWILGVDSYLSKALHAIATELARIDARAIDLIEEADPRTATELLEDWERLLGLPDGCVLELADNDPDRRLAITAKLIARGGQTPAFYEEIANALGITAVVSELYSRVLRVGFRVGDRCYGLDQGFAWVVTVTEGIVDGALLARPVIASVVRVAGGTLGAATYTYRVSAISASGETIASAEVGEVTALGSSTMRITWGAVTNATGYKVYGRTAGSELLIATLGLVLTYDDTGAITPAGALPAANDARTEIALQMECVIDRAKPAHTTVTFEYEE